MATNSLPLPPVLTPYSFPPLPHLLSSSPIPQISSSPPPSPPSLSLPPFSLPPSSPLAQPPTSQPPPRSMLTGVNADGVRAPLSSPVTITVPRVTTEPPKPTGLTSACMRAERGRRVHTCVVFFLYSLETSPADVSIERIL